MLQSLPTTTFLTLSLLASVATASPITHEELLELQKKSAESQPVREVHPKNEKAESREDSNLLANSQILRSGETWTLVPKTAVICFPAQYSDKLVAAPKGKFVPWSKFLSANFAWLDTKEIDISTSSGATTMKYESFALLKNSNKVIVATLNGGPVSIVHDAIEKEPSEK